MIAPLEFLNAFREQGVTFFTGVPDSLLKEFCACVDAESPDGTHVIAANEGGALAMAAGVQLATGRVPVVYLQNSGFGNLVNPLLSLADPAVYAIPVVLLVGWRGEPGVKDEPQHLRQGEAQLALHDALGLPTKEISATSGDWRESVRWAVEEATRRSGPVALLVRKGAFAAYKAPRVPDIADEMSRENAIELILERVGADDVIVCTTGMASRELFEVREQRGQAHGNDFLTVGCMGHASSIAAGIALAQRDRTVWCLDGDGAALMHLGAIPVIGAMSLGNFRHVLLNNGAHDSVGGQPTVGGQFDFGELCARSGYRSISRASTAAELRACLQGLGEGPSFLEVRVRKGARSDLGRPTSSPKDNKALLMDVLGTRA
jgi:phosphonopyruvate decarboxylase